jgi:hypothetical protein
MLMEAKILFDNIRNFRQLLKEGVGDNDLIDAIQNHEYINIYYTGDDGIQAGNRTIRPYVLGTTKAGNKVLRAWQDNYKSVSYRMRGGRNEHEYWTDDLDGKEKPGWRLFRVDRISNVYPTGRKFVDDEGHVIIPPKYKEGSDKQMGGGIIAYVSSTTPSLRAKTGGAGQPDVIGRKVSAFNTQTDKWQRFYNANKVNRKETAADIQKLHKIVKGMWKKKPNNFLVVINKKNEFEAIPVESKHKVPPESIVGNLSSLYDKLVVPVKSTKPEEDRFIRQTREKLEQERTQKNSEEKKPFFK